ncbi:Nuclear receptor corepressor 1 [Caenorhabditis elegans]|uniref:Nuclear receptor corepressor 1 n=1 Tax=Caenorhabditis elegans TaxID=6239 RepID=NCOR1_CAEEL|nr:Nuclear receptor corepressor 1 [Caenorhabditis elegans]P34333.4 RecName: Full=Nuclear receptor corepressor 1; Short=N-CoR; Short=N-CoR1; AltName: Full=Gex-3-interacting protein 8; AltName: Full=Prion-like-(Q/N-rich) domain-bearing protein 12 [Caenorhabditis elegans]CCD64442.1 Nuclear receptor corepressor 1 [Caenorhabditis elegans]|eukprot:NP_498773.3 Nuclear receptor corepressor 1 [Caenorhabditis elegans]
MESFKELAREYDEKFKAFQDDLQKWEETSERKEYAEFHRVQAESEFPELKREREDRERWARAERIRGEDEKSMLAKEHADKKIRLGVAKIPRLLTESERKMDEFVERPGSILKDMKKEHRQSVLDRLEEWSPEERSLFKSRQADHVKIFHGLTEFFVDKTASDLVLFYYMNKKTEDYKKDFKPKKRVTKYKVGAFPSVEELAYFRMMPPLDFSSFPKNSLMCYFCCRTVNGIDLNGTFMPKEAYEIFAICPDEDRVVCSGCREEAAKLYKDNRCFGNRCSNQKKRANRVNRNIPLDFADFPVRTRAFIMDKLGSTRVAVKFCTPCKNALTRWINDVNNKEETIMAELLNYEGQVGWTDDEKTKLVTLINSSPTLDWVSISEGMNRRPNECKMQYDAMNGVKTQPMIEEVDEEDGNGQEEGGDALVNTPTTSSAAARRSGLARNAKKPVRTPRAPRSAGGRRTGGAVTRAQAVPKPVEDLGEEIDEMEIEDNDEDASRGSRGKDSKAPSDRDGSPADMEGDSPEGQDQDADQDQDQDQDVDEEEEEVIVRDIDSPVKTLLSPKILSGGHKPDFPPVPRIQKPSTSSQPPPPEPMDTKENESDDGEEDNDILEIDVDEPPAKRPTPTSSSSHLIGSSSVGGSERELGGRGLVQQQQQQQPQAQSAAPPVTVSTAAAATAERLVNATSPSPSVASQHLVPTETSTSVPPVTIVPPAIQQPVVVISGAAPQFTQQQTTHSPALIAQPIPQQLIPQRVSTPAQILTPTPVRPTAASTPSMDQFLGLFKQQQQQQQQQPQQSNLMQQLGNINPQFLALLLQQQQQQQQVQQAQVQAAQTQGSLTSGTPFQAQQRPDEALQKLFSSPEMLGTLLNAKYQFPQFPQAIQQNPLLMNAQHQLILQQQQLAMQHAQAQAAQAAQAQAAQAAQAQAQAQAEAKLKTQAAQAKAQADAQARVQTQQQAHLKAQAQAQYQMNRPQLIPASVQMPIGINTAYHQKSLTPSETSASATPPAHRPRAATTVGSKMPAGRSNVQEAELRTLKEELIKRIRLFRDRIAEDAHLKREEENIVTYTAQIQASRVQYNTEILGQMKQRYEQAAARRIEIVKELDEPAKFINGVQNKFNDFSVFKLDEIDRQTLHEILQRYAAEQKPDQLQQQQNDFHNLLRQNNIGIRQAQYPALQASPHQAAIIQHQQQQEAFKKLQQQHQDAQKRKLEAPVSSATPQVKRIALSQSSPVQRFSQHPNGTLPHNLAVVYQNKMPQDREKLLQEQQLNQYLFAAQQQHLQQQQQHHGTQPEQKSKRKSGIESITSMQGAPHRHIQLAGPSSSRIQSGRGVSPALSASRSVAPTISGAAGRSITAGTSGHSSTSDYNKELAERMNEVFKPTHPQLLQTKASAMNSNAVSPANTNNSDEIECVYQGPPKTPASIKRLQPTEGPRTLSGQRMKSILSVPAHQRRSSIPPVKTEDEAMECLSMMMYEEAKAPPSDRIVTKLISSSEAAAAANPSAKFSYLDIFNDVVKRDEERCQRMLQSTSVLQPSRELDAFLQQLQQNPQQYANLSAAEKLALQQYQIHSAHQKSQQQAQLQAAQQLQQQQQARPDHYEKFHLLRPNAEIVRPIPTTFSHFLNKATTSTVSSSASAPQFLQPPAAASIAAPTPISTPHAMPSPSVGVQTAPPTPQAVHHPVMPIIPGKPSSVNSNVSDVSSDDDDVRNPEKLPANRLPPLPGDKTAFRSVIDLRATGHVAVTKKIPVKYPLVVQAQNGIQPIKDYGPPCKNLVYEDLSDDE